MTANIRVPVKYVLNTHLIDSKNIYLLYTFFLNTQNSPFPFIILFLYKPACANIRRSHFNLGYLCQNLKDNRNL